MVDKLAPFQQKERAMESRARSLEQLLAEMGADQQHPRVKRLMELVRKRRNRTISVEESDEYLKLFTAFMEEAVALGPYPPN